MYWNNVSGLENYQKAGGPGLEKGRKQVYFQESTSKKPNGLLAKRI